MTAQSPDPTPEEIEEARRILADHAQVWPAPASSPSRPAPADDWAISKAELHRTFQEEAIDRPKREIAAQMIGQLARLPGVLIGDFARAAELVMRSVTAWPARPRGRRPGSGTFERPTEQVVALLAPIVRELRRRGYNPTEDRVIAYLDNHSPEYAGLDKRQLRRWIHAAHFADWDDFLQSVGD